MIVVKIELWPHGIRDKAREIGRIVIANDGSGTKEEGNYEVALANAGIYADKPGAWKSGTVTKHKRSLSPYHLIRAAIDSALRNRRKAKWADKYVDCTREGNLTPGESFVAGIESLQEKTK
jgi:hypothetical protein